VSWVIVCPDGHTRHYAYATEEDAEEDADLCDRIGCRFYALPTELERKLPPCDGHPHLVLEGDPDPPN
jgi:hypothetical protein